MDRRFKKRSSVTTRRNSRGGMLIFGIATLAVLIAVGLCGYEISSIRTQFNELQASCDAAVLASAVWINSSANQALTQKDPSTIQQVGITYFRLGQVLNSPLSSAKLSPTADKDSPPAGQSEFYLNVDAAKQAVSGTAVFGYQPLFFPGLGPIPLRVNAHAEPTQGGLHGDVCIVVDLSQSMQAGTDHSKTRVYQQHVFKTTCPNCTLPANFPNTGNASFPSWPNITKPPLPPPYKKPAPANMPANFPASGTIYFTVAAPNTHRGGIEPEILNDSGHYNHTIPNPGCDPIPNSNQGNDSNYPSAISFTPDPQLNVNLSGPPDNFSPTMPVSPVHQAGAGLDSAPQTLIDSAHTPNFNNVLNAYCEMRANTPVSQLPVYPPSLANGNPRPYTLQEVLLTLLAEAKQGNLDTGAAYYANNSASKTVLDQITSAHYPNPIPAKVEGPGGHNVHHFQAEYQRLAMTLIQPHQGTTEAVHYLIDQLVPPNGPTPKNLHLSLICYGAFAGGLPLKPPHTPTVDQNAPNINDELFLNYDHIGRFHEAYVPLSLGQDVRKAAQQIKDYIDVADISYGTNTPQALDHALYEVTGPNHMQGQPKNIVLLTDGIPTSPGSFAKAAKAHSLGVNLFVIGYFYSHYAYPAGIKFCQNLIYKSGEAQKGQDTSKYFYGIGNGHIPDVYTKDDILLQQLGSSKAMQDILKSAGAPALQ